MSTILIIVLTA